MLCPRRQEAPNYPNFPDHDEWIRARDSEYQTCSFCGSITPEDFFLAIDTGCEIVPTDKSYKVYVKLPEPNPHVLRVVGSSTRDESPGADWLALTPHLCERYGYRMDGLTKWLLLGERGSTWEGKFYFQHLSEYDRHRFIACFNTHLLNLGYPGFFYTTPYFCKEVKS